MLRDELNREYICKEDLQAMLQSLLKSSGVWCSFGIHKVIDMLPNVPVYTPPGSNNLDGPLCRDCAHHRSYCDCKDQKLMEIVSSGVYHCSGWEASE